jgi:hypothetical protein
VLRVSAQVRNFSQRKSRPLTLSASLIDPLGNRCRCQMIAPVEAIN